MRRFLRLCGLSALIVASTAAVRVAPALASTACPPDPQPQSTITGDLVVNTGDFCFISQVTITGNLIVTGPSSNGPSYTDLGFSTVKGQVIVRSGGQVNIHDSSVGSGVVARGAGYVLVFSSAIDHGVSIAKTTNGLGFLCDTAVRGDVSVSYTHSTAFPMTIGDPANDCASNTISGAVRFTQNVTNALIHGNVANGITVSSNPSTTPFDIANNVITGQLACYSNAVAPTEAGTRAPRPASARACEPRPIRWTDRGAATP